jgi:hypothetical protein
MEREKKMNANLKEKAKWFVWRLKWRIKNLPANLWARYFVLPKMLKEMGIKKNEIPF